MLAIRILLSLQALCILSCSVNPFEDYTQVKVTEPHAKISTKGRTRWQGDANLVWIVAIDDESTSNTWRMGHLRVTPGTHKFSVAVGKEPQNMGAVKVSLDCEAGKHYLFMLDSTNPDQYFLLVSDKDTGWPIRGFGLVKKPRQ